MIGGSAINHSVSASVTFGDINVFLVRLNLKSIKRGGLVAKREFPLCNASSVR